MQLLPADLKDERLIESLGGLVYSQISIPTSQFQAQWDAFMASVQSSGFATPALVDQKVAAGVASAASYADERIAVGNYGIASLVAANAYRLVTDSGDPTVLVAGTTVRFKTNAAHTGTPMLAIASIPSMPYKEIRKGNGNQITGAYLREGSVYTVTYDGTVFILQGEGGEYGNATAAQVLAGTTIGTEDGLKNGTMTNRSGTTVQSYFDSHATIPNGYYSGIEKIPPPKMGLGNAIILEAGNGYGERGTTAPTQILALRVKFSGVCRVSYNMYGANSYAGGNNFTRIYKNDVSVSPTYMIGSGYGTVTVVYDFTEPLAPNDIIAVWAYVSNGYPDAAVTITDFKLMGSYTLATRGR